MERMFGVAQLMRDIHRQLWTWLGRIINRFSNRYFPCLLRSVALKMKWKGKCFGLLIILGSYKWRAFIIPGTWVSCPEENYGKLNSVAVHSSTSKGAGSLWNMFMKEIVSYKLGLYGKREMGTRCWRTKTSHLVQKCDSKESRNCNKSEN